MDTEVVDMEEVEDVVEEVVDMEEEVVDMEEVADMEEVDIEVDMEEADIEVVDTEAVDKVDGAEMEVEDETKGEGVLRGVIISVSVIHVVLEAQYYSIEMKDLNVLSCIFFFIIILKLCSETESGIINIFKSLRYDALTWMQGQVVHRRKVMIYHGFCFVFLNMVMKKGTMRNMPVVL